MPSLDNDSANPGRCSQRECHISGFDVEFTGSAEGVTGVITDSCNQVTECRMAKAILSKALIELLTDEDVEIPEAPCSGPSCCDGVYGAEYTFATNTVFFEVAGLGAVNTTITVTPPFGTVN